MAVPEVDKKMLGELESMGFPAACSTRALHLTGNSGVEAAINWIVEHEDDPDIDQMPLVPIIIEIENGIPSWANEEVKMKAQRLREYGRRKKEAEEKRKEREREKERIHVGKELLEAKRIEEEIGRKRAIASREADKEEEKRARYKIRQRLEEDKAERRRKLGLPANEPGAAKSTGPPVHEKKFQFSLPTMPAKKAESMRNCLRSVKRSHMDNDAKVKRAFQTLLTYIANVAKNPDEEKFRKIRLSNPVFQERVGSLEGGIEFLQLCGFEKLEGNEFLFMPRDRVDIAVLKSAGLALTSAMANPFFGIL